MSKKIKKAIISLSDKSEIELILNTLKKYKVNIISSGGTSKKVKKLGYSCTEVSEYTRTIPKQGCQERPVQEERESQHLLPRWHR